MSAEEMAYSLDKPRRCGQGKYMACCPAHDDKNPSLAITDTDGTTLVYCFAGCSQAEVITSLRARGLWPEERQRGVNSAPYFTKAELLEMRFYVEIAQAADCNLGTDDKTKLEAYRKVLLSKGVKL